MSEYEVKRRRLNSHHKEKVKFEKLMNWIKKDHRSNVKKVELWYHGEQDRRVHANQSIGIQRF